MIVYHSASYKKALPQQDMKLNERFFANIGLVLFKKIVPEVIEELLWKVQLDLFIKETGMILMCYHVLQKEDLLLNVMNKEYTRHCNACFAIPLNLYIESHEDVQFLTITNDNMCNEKRLEQRKKQLATAMSRNDVDKKPLQLPPLLHKNRWIQVHYLFVHWADTLLFEEITEQSFQCKLSVLGNYIFQCLIYQHTDFRDHLASFSKKMN